MNNQKVIVKIIPILTDNNPETDYFVAGLDIKADLAARLKQ